TDRSDGGPPVRVGLRQAPDAAAAVRHAGQVDSCRINPMPPNDKVQCPHGVRDLDRPGLPFPRGVYGEEHDEFKGAILTAGTEATEDGLRKPGLEDRL